jgi:hypothetical protein
VELVLEHRNFCFKVIVGGSISQVRPEDKMATDLQNGDIIVLSFPHFSLIMMRVGDEDWELRQSVGLLATSCCQGAIVWSKILRLL